MTFGEIKKRNIITHCMMDRIENQVYEIIRSEKSIEAIDKKVDPIIRQYFKECQALDIFYGSQGRKKVDLNENDIKTNKCFLIKQMMELQFKEATDKMLENIEDIIQADENMTYGLKRLYNNIAKVYKFYKMPYVIPDLDEEEGEEDESDNQPEDSEEGLS